MRFLVFVALVVALIIVCGVAWLNQEFPVQKIMEKTGHTASPLPADDSWILLAAVVAFAIIALLRRMDSRKEFRANDAKIVEFPPNALRGREWKPPAA